MFEEAYSASLSLAELVFKDWKLNSFDLTEQDKIKWNANRSKAQVVLLLTLKWRVTLGGLREQQKLEESHTPETFKFIATAVIS